MDARSNVRESTYAQSMKRQEKSNTNKVQLAILNFTLRLGKRRGLMAKKLVARHTNAGPPELGWAGGAIGSPTFASLST